MKNNLKTRKNIRLSNYNYSKNGLYFITICVINRACILSKININTKNVELSEFGIIVEKYIKEINHTYNDIQILKYVIMPNHIHLICELINYNSINTTKPNEKIPFLVSTFKRLTNKASKIKIWQRNYFEHIIRNDDEYIKIWEYIENNPIQWNEDVYYN